jgi:hypothetical protein
MDMIEQLPEVSIPISLLAPGIQLRAGGTDSAHVRLLADAVGTVRLPGIVVQKNSSRVIDGKHRVEVAKLRGEPATRARIVDCTDAEALVLAIQSHTLHGLPLSRADRIPGAWPGSRPDLARTPQPDPTGPIPQLNTRTVAKSHRAADGQAEWSSARDRLLKVTDPAVEFQPVPPGTDVRVLLPDGDNFAVRAKEPFRHWRSAPAG